MAIEKQSADDVVCVVALNSAGFITTCTSCDASDAQHYAKYYRSVGYHARVVTYEELDEMQKKESQLRLASPQIIL